MGCCKTRPRATHLQPQPKRIGPPREKFTESTHLRGSIPQRVPANAAVTTLIRPRPRAAPIALATASRQQNLRSGVRCCRPSLARPAKASTSHSTQGATSGQPKDANAANTANANACNNLSCRWLHAGRLCTGLNSPHKTTAIPSESSVNATVGTRWVTARHAQGHPAPAR